MTSQNVPTLHDETALFRSGVRVLGSIDEVGRGALAGPVSCGIVLLDATCDAVPTGLRDSKLLSASVREALVPAIREWVLDAAVGHASAREIDERGLTAALRLAGQRALRQLNHLPDAILLDGSFDWMSPPRQPQLDDIVDECVVEVPPVTTKVKGDLTCASVAAASVLAKVERDALMARFARDYPEYGWESNKGYGAAAHVRAIRERGRTAQHRKSWNLPDQSTTTSPSTS